MRCTRVFLLRGSTRRIPRAALEKRAEALQFPGSSAKQAFKINDRRMEAQRFMSMQKTGTTLELQRVNTIRRKLAALRVSKNMCSGTLRRSQRNVPLRVGSGSGLALGISPSMRQMCLQIGGRGLGPRQMHRRHASAFATHNSIGCGILQCAKQEVSEVAFRNLDSVAQTVSYTGMWGAIRTFPKRHPFLTNLILSVTGYSLADYIVQRSEEKEIDRKRILSFACFGFVQGCVAWTAFVKVFSKLTPGSVRFSNLSLAEKLTNRQGQIDVIKQTILDNFVYTPLIFFPIFYSCKSCIQSEHGEHGDLCSRLREAVGQYYDNLVDDNVASCKIWLWGDLLIFTVPAWMRMPVFQGVNFGFSVVLSHMRGSSEPNTQITAGAVGAASVTWSASPLDVSKSLERLQHRFLDLYSKLPSVHVSCSC